MQLKIKVFVVAIVVKPLIKKLYIDGLQETRFLFVFCFVVVVGGIIYSTIFLCLWFIPSTLVN